MKPSKNLTLNELQNKNGERYKNKCIRKPKVCAAEIFYGSKKKFNIIVDVEFAKSNKVFEASVASSGLLLTYDIFPISLSL